MQELVLTALRAVVVYVFVLAVVRILGKRTIGNFSAIDLIVALTMTEVVDETIYGDRADVPPRQGFAAAGTLVAPSRAVSIAAFRSPLVRRLVSQVPTPVRLSRAPDREGMSEEHFGDWHLDHALRLAGLERRADARAVRVEENGRTSVLRTKESRRARRGDLESLRDVLS